MKRLLFLIVPVLALVLNDPTVAMDPERAERLALENDPKLAELEARARAARERAVADGSLPDPQLMGGVNMVPLPDLSLNAEPMAMTELGIRQRFPARARRDALSTIGRSEAAELAARAELRALQIRRTLREVWLALTAVDELAENDRRQVDVLDQLIETLEARLRSGEIGHAELLAIRTRQARLTRRLPERRAEQAALRARLAEVIGTEAPYDAITRREFSPPTAIDPENHPELELALAGIRVAESRVDAAAAGKRPGWEMQFGVGRRWGNTPMGAPSDTLIAASVMIDLPLFTRNRQDRRISAARAEAAAAETGPVEVRRRLVARMVAALAGFEENEELVRHYGEVVRSLAEDMQEAARSEYQAGFGGLLLALEARLTTLEVEAERIELKAARDRAAIELMYLGGE